MQKTSFFATSKLTVLTACKTEGFAALKHFMFGASKIKDFRMFVKQSFTTTKIFGFCMPEKYTIF
jgi:hypothetical protein